jgi:hypothetical protein
MQRSASGYVFNKRVTIKGLRHIGTTSSATLTATLTISGTAVSGAINGTVKVKAPGCLSRTLVEHYSGH